MELPEYRNDFYVPEVIDSMSTKHILTQEFIEGMPVDEVATLPQSVRDRVGTLLIKNCIDELFKLKLMQTDPNPANFYYCP